MGRKKTIKEIKTALPDLQSEQVELISDELDRVLGLKALFKSDGGKELIKVLRDNCVRALTRLVQEAKDKPEVSTLVGLIATYSANIDLLAQLQEIKFEEELRNQLDEAVKEAME